MITIDRLDPEVVERAQAMGTSDLRYPDFNEARCTCHVMRDGSGGMLYTEYQLGVLCRSCESYDSECEAVADWNDLPLSERMTINLDRAQREVQAIRDQVTDEDPPF